jgi:hypothetical protein
MIHFKSIGGGHEVKTELGKITVYHGTADEKGSFLIRIASHEGEIRHDILLTEASAYCLSALIPIAAMASKGPLEVKERELDL